MSAADEPPPPLSPLSPREKELPKPKVAVRVLKTNFQDPKGPAFGLQLETIGPPFTTTFSAPTRTYFELERLHQYICRLYPGHIPTSLPPLPSRQEDVASFKIRIREWISSLMNEYGNAPGIVLFAESQFEFFPPDDTPQLKKPTSAGGGILRALTGGRNVAKEVDAFFDSAKVTASTANTALSTCARVGDKVARLDTELAKDCEQVSSHMNAFALVEDKSVISACKRLGRAFAASGNLHTEQATFLSGSFVEECKKCLKDTQTAQAALDHRFATLQEYDSSCKLTQRKLVALDKIRSSSNIRQDKVDAALEDLQEAKEEESKGRRSFRTISEVLRPEFEKHLEQQEKDIQVVIDQYVNEQIQHSTRQLEVFKAALNDISLLDERMRYPENL